MRERDRIASLRNGIARLRFSELAIHRTLVWVDERQNGELVTRVVLVVDDPRDDTWDVHHVSELRQSIGRLATGLELPPVSLTLVPESEAELVESLHGLIAMQARIQNR